jgi:ubiquinone/menaquinone biosynthesis C-methylase UbiE
MQDYLTLHTVETCAGFFTPHLRPSMSLLDAGCGPGTITIGLAPLIAPGGRLAAVDLSADEVEKTRQALESAGYGPADVQVADVRELPFEDCTFDALFSEAVIDYLPDPMLAVREFERVLKPGGVIGLRSLNSDYALIGPHNELIEESLVLFRRAVESYGGNVGRGRLLGRMLKDCGFERIFTQPVYLRAESPEEWQSFCRIIGTSANSGQFAETALREGWADEARLAEIAEEWERFGADSSNFMGLAWGQAVGFKPA